ncbi:MAG: hypothetical protein J7J46_10395 [Candidatus Desulfofervidus sp.]|nr:hypothetical protein [Candidatus Desulfofervidus sp.]
MRKKNILFLSTSSPFLKAINRLVKLTLLVVKDVKANFFDLVIILFTDLYDLIAAVIIKPEPWIKKIN